MPIDEREDFIKKYGVKGECIVNDCNRILSLIGAERLKSFLPYYYPTSPGEMIDKGIAKVYNKKLIFDMKKMTQIGKLLEFVKDIKLCLNDNNLKEAKVVDECKCCYTISKDGLELPGKEWYALSKGERKELEHALGNKAENGFVYV